MTVHCTCPLFEDEVESEVYLVPTYAIVGRWTRSVNVGRDVVAWENFLVALLASVCDLRRAIYNRSSRFSFAYSACNWLTISKRDTLSASVRNSVTTSDREDFNSERRDWLERVMADNWSVIRLVELAGEGVGRGVSGDRV